MKNRLIKAVVFCSIVLFSMNSFAQTPPGDENELGNLEGTATDSGVPISDYVIPMLILGVLIGYRYNRKAIA